MLKQPGGQAQPSRQIQDDWESPQSEVNLATAVIKTEPLTFMSQLSKAEERVLFLDYDGTLAPFSIARNRAFPYAEVPELLDSISNTCRTRVVLISGRRAQEIPPLLGHVPELEIWGSHGLERIRPDGAYEVHPVAADALKRLDEAEAQLESEGLAELCEKKPGALAVHWRGLQANEVAEVRTAAFRALVALACTAELRLAEFDGGVELRTRASNKEYAVRAVLSEMSEEAAVAYLGDDTSDEDAFQQVNGTGLTVLVRPSYRPTRAQVWLKPPDEMIQFLLDWVQACGGDV